MALACWAACTQCVASAVCRLPSAGAACASRLQGARPACVRPALHRRDAVEMQAAKGKKKKKKAASKKGPATSKGEGASKRTTRSTSKPAPPASDPSAEGILPHDVTLDGLESGEGAGDDRRIVLEEVAVTREARSPINPQQPLLRMEMGDWTSLRIAPNAPFAEVMEVSLQPCEGSGRGCLTAHTSDAPCSRHAQGVTRAVEKESLDSFVSANRDHVNKRFQFQLMADALRRKSAGDDAGEARLRSILSAVVVANRAFDKSLAASIEAREQALNQAFEMDLPDGQKPTIVDLAGPEPMDQLGFWVVIAAAKEAWVERLGEVEDSDRSLREAIARKIGQMDQFLQAIALTQEIQPEPVHFLLKALSVIPEEEGAAATLDADFVAFNVGCLVGCLECLRYQSYSALAGTLVQLYDAIACGNARYLDMGGPLAVDSALDLAQRDGTMSSLIKYELEQEKIDTRDSTVTSGRVEARWGGFWETGLCRGHRRVLAHDMLSPLDLGHLRARKVMRPLVRSYGLSSTFTLSPTRTLIKFFRIFPEICASTTCSVLAISTRNMALGSFSVTTPSTSMTSSLASMPACPRRPAEPGATGDRALAKGRVRHACCLGGGRKAVAAWARSTARASLRAIAILLSGATCAKLRSFASPRIMSSGLASNPARPTPADARPGEKPFGSTLSFPHSIHSPGSQRYLVSSSPRVCAPRSSHVFTPRFELVSCRQVDADANLGH